MTEGSLHRKFPGCETRTLECGRYLFWEGREVKCPRSRKETKDWSILERRMLALAARQRMDQTGWRDTQLGMTGVPLQIHHKVFRSHQGDHQLNNLEPLTLGGHKEQHD